jgi:hypothetical protein
MKGAEDDDELESPGLKSSFSGLGANERYSINVVKAEEN